MSAEKEQENYSKSIQYSIDRAKASLQELANDIVSSDLVKGVVDLFTQIIQGLDKIAEHPLLALMLGGGIAGGVGILKTLKTDAENLSEDLNTDAIDRNTAATDLNTESKISNAKARTIKTEATNSENISEDLNTEANRDDTVSEIEEAAAEETSALTSTSEALATAKETVTEKANIVANSAKNVLNQVTTSVSAAGAAFTAAGGGVAGFGAALGALPITWVVAGIAALTAGIVWVADKAITTAKEAKEAFEDAKQEYESGVSELDGMNSELKGINSQIEDIKSDGVILTEQDDLDRLIAERTNLELMVEAQKLLNEEKAKETADAGFEAFGKKSNSFFGNEYSKNANNYKKAKDKVDEINDQIEKAIKDGDSELVEKLKRSRENALVELSNANTDVAADISELLDFKQSYENADKYYQEANKNKYQGVIDTLKRDFEGIGKSGEWNEMQILSAFDSLGWTEEEIKKLANGEDVADKSTKDLGKAIQDLQLIGDKNDWLKLLNQYLKEYVEETENATKSTKDYNGILSGVQGLSTGFDQIGKVYADVQNGEEFDYSSILNNEEFSKTFSGYKEEYDAFIKTVSESPDDINACQSAFNNLATAYVYGSKVLDDLTEETAEATEHMLTYMGVTNASEVVQNALNTGVRAEAAAWELLAQLQERGISAKQQATQSTDEYISVIGTEIQALATEKGYSESTTKALYAMYIQQLMATNNPFNSAKSVEQLGVLIRALGQATQAYADFQKYQQFALMSLDTKRSKNEQNWYGKWAKAYENKLRNTNYVDQVEVGTSPAISYAAPPSFSSGDSGSGGSSSDAAKEFSEEIDWIEIKISRLQREIDNFDKKVSATWKNWTDRTQALNQEFWKTLDLTNQQTNAFWRYLQQAESVGLPEAYKQLVQNGTIDISTITDEGLKDQIDQYQQWYEKALQAADAIDDLKQSVVDLVNVNFEGIQKRFDQAVSSIEHSINMIQKSEDLLTAKGYKSSTSFYSWQNDAINANQSNLLQERSELTSLMNAATNGFVDATSEQYKEWQASIDEIDEQLKDNEITIAENTQAIRDLIEEYFDYNITQIDRINSEADFIKNIMSYSQLTDKKGNFTNEGWSSMAMSGVKYNVYMEEADKYAAKIAEYTRLLNNDPYNVDINDQLNDYIDKQRDAINNALSATDEIKDMVSDMLNELLDNLSKAADKYMNEINSEKNLFDYQRDIQSKTDEISGYQKQINSLSGDDSEENRARLQQLRENLATSREDLQQTEYERWISDQQSMLDNMQDEAQAWVTQYLDEFQTHLGEWIGQINANQQNIGATITSEVNSLGAKLSNSMETIIAGNGNNSLIKAYNDNFGTGVNNAIQNINNYIIGLQKKAEEEARAAAEAERQRIAAQQAAQAQAAAQAAAQAQAAQAQAGGAGWGSWFVQKQDNYPKNRLNTETSIVDRLKYHNIASDMGHRAAYYSAMGGGGSYRGTDAQNVWMIQQMKLHGYYKGGKNISDELAWTQEKGAEIIRRSDGALLTPVKGATVFSNGQTEALWNLSKLMTNSINTASLPNSISHYSSGTVNNDMKISFNLPNVSNYQEFVAQLKSDGSFEKFIQQATIGNALGKNTLLKNRY